MLLRIAVLINLSAAAYDLGVSRLNFQSLYYAGNQHTYIVGTFIGSAKLEQSTDFLGTSGLKDLFLEEYDSQGVLLNQVLFGGVRDDNEPTMSIDESGYLIVAALTKSPPGSWQQQCVDNSQNVLVTAFKLTPSTFQPLWGQCTNTKPSVLGVVAYSIGTNQYALTLEGLDNSRLGGDVNMFQPVRLQYSNTQVLSQTTLTSVPCDKGNCNNAETFIGWNGKEIQIASRLKGPSSQLQFWTLGGTATAASAGVKTSTQFKSLDGMSCSSDFGCSVYGTSQVLLLDCDQINTAMPFMLDVQSNSITKCSRLGLTSIASVSRMAGFGSLYFGVASSSSYVGQYYQDGTYVNWAVNAVAGAVGIGAQDFNGVALVGSGSVLRIQYIPITTTTTTTRSTTTSTSKTSTTRTSTTSRTSKTTVTSTLTTQSSTTSTSDSGLSTIVPIVATTYLTTSNAEQISSVLVTVSVQPQQAYSSLSIGQVPIQSHLATLAHSTSVPSQSKLSTEAHEIDFTYIPPEQTEGTQVQHTISTTQLDRLTVDQQVNQSRILVTVIASILSVGLVIGLLSCYLCFGKSSKKSRAVELYQVGGNSRTNLLASSNQLLSTSHDQLSHMIRSQKTGLAFQWSGTATPDKETTVRDITTSYTEFSHNTTIIEPNSRELSIPGFLMMQPGEDYQLTGKLSEGGYANIMMCKLRNKEAIARNGSSVCVIKITKPTTRKSAEQAAEEAATFLQEVSVMQLFSNVPNFVKLIGYSTQPYSILIKYYPHGSLQDVLFDENPRVPYSAQLMLSLFKDICNALNEMYRSGIVHYDIKGANVLIESKSDLQVPFTAVLADFGVSKIVTNQVAKVSGFVMAKLNGVSIDYAAPEYLQQGIQGTRVSDVKAFLQFKVDIYALAIVAYEMFTKRHAWLSTTLKATLVNQIIEGKRPIFPEQSPIDDFTNVMRRRSMTQQLKLLIQDMWENDPNQRPNIQVVIQRVKLIESASD